MRESWIAWWKLRTPRERKLLIVLAPIAILVLFWLAVILPLDNALAAAKQRHGEAVVAQAEARAQLAAIGRIERNAAPPLTAPVGSMLSSAAVEAGFPVTGITSNGPGEARIVISSARPQAFFGWVGQMENRGLAVDRLSASPNADQTLTVEVTFKARGR